jgi:hypothetical protein
LQQLIWVSSCFWVLASNQPELPDDCNRGIGTTLLHGLQAEAAAAGQPLRIHVERFNPALRLYERLGFRQIDDRGVYLFMEWVDDNSQRSNDPKEAVRPNRVKGHRLAGTNRFTQHVRAGLLGSLGRWELTCRRAGVD